MIRKRRFCWVRRRFRPHPKGVATWGKACWLAPAPNQRGYHIEYFNICCNVVFMDTDTAVTSLAALAHPQRLDIFRLLVRQGPNGVPAGEIAAAVGASPTAASFHLKELDRAGLISATRHGRFIRYAVHIEGMRALLAFLSEDCCEGRPELCGGDLAKLKSTCVSRE